MKGLVRMTLVLLCCLGAAVWANRVLLWAWSGQVTAAVLGSVVTALNVYVGWRWLGER